MITMEKCSCDCGDSGSTVWSGGTGGTGDTGGGATILGMVISRGEWIMNSENMIATVNFKVPAWVLNDLVERRFI